MKSGGVDTEPRRDCRRLQLLRGWSDDNQNDEHVFPRSAFPCGADGSGSKPLRHWSEQWLREGEHASRWAAVSSIGAKIGCATQTLHEWVKKAEVDSGAKPGLTTDMAARVKALEREVRELRQANEILRKASAYFAQVRKAMRHCFSIACSGSTARSSDDRLH